MCVGGAFKALVGTEGVALGTQEPNGGQGRGILKSHSPLCFLSRREKEPMKIMCFKVRRQENAHLCERAFVMSD